MYSLLFFFLRVLISVQVIIIFLNHKVVIYISLVIVVQLASLLPEFFRLPYLFH